MGSIVAWRELRRPGIFNKTSMTRFKLCLRAWKPRVGYKVGRPNVVSSVVGGLARWAMGYTGSADIDALQATPCSPFGCPFAALRGATCRRLFDGRRELPHD